MGRLGVKKETSNCSEEKIIWELKVLVIGLLLARPGLLKKHRRMLKLFQ